MGHVTTPTFRLELPLVIELATGKTFAETACRWDCHRAGRPTAANLAKHIRGYEDSTLPGGCNEHLGVTRVARARVIRQSTGEVVASFGYGDRPMFEVA